MKPTGKNIYKEHLQEDLHRKALVMERTLLLLSPVSVLFFLNRVLLFRAFIDWALFKQSFSSNPNLVWIGYSKYIMLPLIVVIFVYSIYESKKASKYGKL